MVRSIKGFIVFFLTFLLIMNGLIFTVNAASNSNTFQYAIKKGDTLYSLALRFDTNVKDITSLNPGINPNNLTIGSKIKIIAGSGIILHNVKKGDTLWRIAKKYNSTVDAIAKKNNIKDPDVIYVGDILAIPQNDVRKEIMNISKQVVTALKDRDFNKVASYVHPKKGVRFTPYAYVQDHHLVFKASQISKFASDNKKYLWGYFDGSGDPMNLTPMEYYKRFVYDKDYVNAKDISYNKIIGSGNSLENQFQYYPGCNIVEYYIPGSDQYSGMDWGSLRLVFEKYNNKWHLVGIIHNQWTI